MNRPYFKRAKSKEKKQCTEVQNTENQNKKKQSKQEFFESIPCFYFFVTLVQIQWPSQDINQVSLLNSFFKILIYISCYP